MSKTGKLSINSENMLPIIKKWLYSDHDIFVREQIANAFLSSRVGPAFFDEDGCSAPDQ